MKSVFDDIFTQRTDIIGSGICVMVGEIEVLSYGRHGTQYSGSGAKQILLTCAPRTSFLYPWLFSEHLKIFLSGDLPGEKLLRVTVVIHVFIINRDGCPLVHNTHDFSPRFEVEYRHPPADRSGRRQIPSESGGTRAGGTGISVDEAGEDRLY